MSKTIRVDLPEEGADKYVDIVNPMFMRWKEQRLMQQGDGEEALDHSTRMINFLVRGGNITAEDGRTLSYPLPSADIDELTNYTVKQVMSAFKNAADDLEPAKN